MGWLLSRIPVNLSWLVPRHTVYRCVEQEENTADIYIGHSHVNNKMRIPRKDNALYISEVCAVAVY